MQKHGEGRSRVVEVAASDLKSVVRGLVERGARLECITAVDKPKDGVIELHYVFYSHEERSYVIIVVRVDRGERRLESIVDIHPGAWVYEAEVYDMFGVVFEGNDKLRRLFTPPDLKTHPLLKS